MEKCRIDWCERNKRSLWFCKIHYNRYRAHGDPNFTKTNYWQYDSLHELYSTYTTMKKRCMNKKYLWYNRYWWRWIKVCDRWLGKDGFRKFIADMWNRPSKKHSIDRIDNNWNYSPENCRWATFNQQSINRCNNRELTNVYQHFKKWKVTIDLNGKRNYLWLFDDLEKAILARDIFKIENNML